MKLLLVLTFAALIACAAPAVVEAEAGPPPVQWSEGLRAIGEAEMLVSPDGGRVYLSIHGSGGSCSRRGMGVVAFDADDGSRVWIRRSISGLKHMCAEAEGLSPNGRRLYVTGIDHRRIWVAALRSDDGSQLWFEWYRPPGRFIELPRARSSWPRSPAFPTSIAGIVASDDQVVLAASVTKEEDGSDSYFYSDWLTLALRDNGELAWSREVGEPWRDDDPFTLAMSPDGASLVVTGRAAGDFDSVSYGPSGHIQWHRAEQGRAASFSATGDEVFIHGGGKTTAIAMASEIPIWSATAAAVQSAYTDEDDIDVAGAGVVVTSYDIHEPGSWVGSYVPATGAENWGFTYDPTGDDDAVRSIASAGGQVFLAGFSESASWTRRWFIAASDEATGLASWQYLSGRDHSYANDMAVVGGSPLVAVNLSGHRVKVIRFASEA